MISNSTITNTTFDYNVTLLNVQDAIIDKCSFKGLINNASISGNLTKCQFEGLSDGIVITGPLNDMTILSDLTPSSANYVQDANFPSRYISILQLSISLQVVPRLAENLHKDCVVANKNGMQIFIVLLLTDDNTPSGVILMWSGDINNVPSGYGVCDGRIINGVLMPDLSGRFIRMISLGESIGDKPNSDLTDNGSGTRNGYIQIHDYNLPSHQHYFKLSNISVDNQLQVSQYTGTTREQYTYSYSCSGGSIGTGDSGSTTISSVCTDTGYLSVDLGHSHNLTGSITFSADITLDQTLENFENRKICIEPNAYALVFIMKL